MKKLILIPVGGLANRFYAITSAIAFCKDYDVKLKIIWFKDKGMGANFHSLFELSNEVDKSKVEIIDAKWYHYIYDRPRKRNLWLPWICQIFAFSKCVRETVNWRLDDEYIVRGNLYVAHYCQFYHARLDLNTIRFNYRIINTATQKISGLSGRIIGIHIRRSDNIHSIKESPLSLFIEKIKYELNLCSETIFYVASDSLDEKMKLKNIFKEKIITDLSPVSRDNEIGITNALVDLYILSSTVKIYGSSGSTFSMLAARIGGVELEIISLKK